MSEKIQMGTVLQIVQGVKSIQIIIHAMNSKSSFFSIFQKRKMLKYFQNLSKFVDIHNPSIFNL